MASSLYQGSCFHISNESQFHINLFLDDLGVILDPQVSQFLGVDRITNISNPVSFHPTEFLWKSKVLFKVNAFAWLVGYKKKSINDMLQLRRPFKSLSLD